MQGRTTLSPPTAEWRAIPIGKEWNDSFRSFQRSAFRLETLQAYAEPSESSPFNRYRRGDVPDPAFISEWCSMVDEHRAAGRTMRRVHIVDLPLSEYIRFEIECCYRDTARAGENIRLVDRATLEPTMRQVTQEDFWLFDDATVMVNDYDHDGALYGARISTAQSLVTHYASIERKVWDLSLPFEDFYRQAGRK